MYADISAAVADVSQSVMDASPFEISYVSIPYAAALAYIGIIVHTKNNLKIKTTDADKAKCFYYVISPL